MGYEGVDWIQLVHNRVRNVGLHKVI